MSFLIKIHKYVILNFDFVNRSVQIFDSQIACCWISYIHNVCDAYQ